MGFYLGAGGSEQMRLTSTGLGIGTSSPGAKLVAAAASPIVASRGTAYLYSTNSMAANLGGQLSFGGSFTGTTETIFASVAGRKETGTDNDISGYLQFSTTNVALGNVERMRIASNGVVTMNAYGAGAATFSAAGVISSVSDETWKTKDGAPVDPDAMLKKLEPGYWYYNDEKKETFGADRQLGFYAQNVNAAIGPEAAPEPEEGKPWGYYDRSVLAVVVMSLQKALSTIESLEARIAALEQK
jgi:hypothetical protein